MSQAEFPPLKDDDLSVTLLNIAAKWAAEAHPFKEGAFFDKRDVEAVTSERISLMAMILKKLQDAMPRGQALDT